MSAITEERFYDLALKRFLNRCTDQELDEMKSAMVANPGLKDELARLQTEFIAAKELASLMAATDATGSKPSQAARKRFRAKVGDYLRKRENETASLGARVGSTKATTNDSQTLSFFIGFFLLFEIASVSIVLHLSSVTTKPWWQLFGSGETHIVWGQAIPRAILATAASALAAYLLTRQK